MTRTTVADGTPLNLEAINQELDGADATTIIRWALREFGGELVMTSSFGAQSAVMLHLVTRVVPDVPVIFIDTAFHFPETYRFCDELAERLGLNLKVFQSELSPAWMVARHGQLWEKGVPGLNCYDEIRKVEPMQRALKQIKPTAWLAGLRREQTAHREKLHIVEMQDSRYKIHPILEWTSQQMYEYLKRHDLPLHPLVKMGYKSIGDWHSTLPVSGADPDRAGRFRGLKQECGLHLPETEAENQSRESSSL